MKLYAKNNYTNQKEAGKVKYKKIILKNTYYRFLKEDNMKFWTVQKKEVIGIINKEGVYKPDFRKSDYLQIIPDLKDLYNIVLEAFNQVNNMRLDGLIYAFLKSDDEVIYQIQDIQEFAEFIKSKKAVIESLWKQFNKNDTVIVELNYNEKFNPIFVDINDFQFLMPPIMLLPPYTKSDVDRIINEMQNGQITRSVYPSNVIQAHLPYIKVENIINIYPMFSLE